MTPTSTAAARPMRKDAVRNRELLISAAREVFAQRGLEASLDDVARHAGLGVGTAYRHFANKRELAGAIIEQAIDRIVGLAEASIEQVEDPWQALVTFLEGALDVQAADRGLREVLMGLYDREQFERIHDRLSSIIHTLLLRAQRAGALRKDVRTSDIGFLMTMIGTVADVGGDIAPEVWRRYLTICLEGLRAGGPRLPHPALTEEEFRRAMAAHKESLERRH